VLFSTNEFSSHQCRYAGILNPAVQVGHGQFKSGSSDISDAHAIEQFPQPMHINGSRNIWHWRTR